MSTNSLPGYGAIHAWVRRRKHKPDFCEGCGVAPPRDLANTSGQYSRELDDWRYLCRRCHMNSDGRNNKLRESGQSRKLLPKTCPVCHTQFISIRKEAKFCSMTCSAIGRKVVARCMQCQREFHPKISNRNAARFCSHTCSALFQWRKNCAST